MLCCQDDAAAAVSHVETLLQRQAQQSASTSHLLLWLRRLGLDQHYDKFTKARVRLRW